MLNANDVYRIVMESVGTSGAATLNKYGALVTWASSEAECVVHEPVEDQTAALDAIERAYIARDGLVRIPVARERATSAEDDVLLGYAWAESVFAAEGRFPRVEQDAQVLVDRRECGLERSKMVGLIYASAWLRWHQLRGTQSAREKLRASGSAT